MVNRGGAFERQGHESPKTPRTLIWPGADHTPRWRPGERMHHLFEAACDAAAPDALAVDTASESLTFRQLDARANQLARYLTCEGFGPGDVLALLFDRSVQSYVALLAVQKICAAYVPLDPAFPADRIDFICDDAGATGILTQCAQSGVPTQVRKLVLDAPEIAQAVADCAPQRIAANEIAVPERELAYIIYTSGTTGRPKGVPIDQSSICNFLRVAGEIYGYDEGDRVYQGLTLAFDFSVEEILVPLMAKATLVPNQTGSSLVGQDLSDFLAARRITAMCCVPTLLATIEAELPDLRLLIVSGEACPQDLVTRWVRNGRRMLNAYGPTETTVTATLAEMRPGETVHIGKPLPTYTGIVLEPDSLTPIDDDRPGELCIAGIGLSAGYLNRPEQTEKAFVHDPFGLPHNPTGKLYRTGDLVRVDEDGDIHYQGRIDTQVKVRGYRIELTEIESVLMQAPGVAQAVVSTWEPNEGVKELVAYFTRSAEAPPDRDVAADLARAARESLPNFMVPAYYEELDKIPLLPSDKADRKALPPPTRGQRMGASRDYVAPASELESRLAAILADLLGMEQISTADHFFDDLGGNSLLMARFCSKVRNADLGIDLAMRDVYLHPTIARLANHAGGQGPAADTTPLRKTLPVYEAPTFNYVMFGVGQYAFGLTLGYVGLLIMWHGLFWIYEATGFWDGYFRAFGLIALFWVLSLAISLGVKWGLVGRWKPMEFPVWSWEHFKHALAKSYQSANPFALYKGTPFYNFYLRMLGADIGWNAVIMAKTVPSCVDMLKVGDGAVIMPSAMMAGYTVEGGIFRTGPISIGRDAFVGEKAIIEPFSSLGDDAQLGHASSLQPGQHVPDGMVVHGSPARPAPAGFRRLPNDRVSLRRKALYLTYIFALPFMVLAPLAIWIFLGVVSWVFTTFDLTRATFPTYEVLPYAFAIGSFFYVFGWMFGLLVNIYLPRILSWFITPGRAYKHYGIRYILLGWIKATTNSEYFNTFFGDSSFIPYYLKRLGYKFPDGIVQTGSNFGTTQSHGLPGLVEIGANTMASDEITFVNLSYSSSYVCAEPVSMGRDSYAGNYINVVPDHRVGDNCLIGTKTALPISGESYSDTGLLGSPAFAIPRSVQRDSEIQQKFDARLREERLKRKDAHNLATMGWLLLRDYVAGAVLFVLAIVMFFETPLPGPLTLWLMAFPASFFVVFYFAAWDWASLGFKRLTGRECSIYDPYFWFHERHWKLHVYRMHAAFAGTPLQGAILRLLGVKVGKKLYAERFGLVEKTMITIGDHCSINNMVILQPHSLEDGAFKSGPITIGNGCSLGTNALIHYSTDLADNTTVEADSFVMKGTTTEPGSVWMGNPAEVARVGSLAHIAPELTQEAGGLDEGNAPPSDAPQLIAAQ